MWVADKRVELDGIRLDSGYNYLTIQLYEQIPGIYGSDFVYILYCDNPPQAQSHTQIVHGNISTTQVYGTAERQTSTRNKIPSPSKQLHVNELQWKLNGGKEFYNKIAEEVIF